MHVSLHHLWSNGITQERIRSSPRPFLCALGSREAGSLGSHCHIIYSNKNLLIVEPLMGTKLPGDDGYQLNQLDVSSQVISV